MKGEKRPPNILQGALIAAEYENWLAGPPVWLQGLLFGPLVLLGRLLGYKASYPRYSDDPVERGER